MADTGAYGRTARRTGEELWGEVALPVIEHEDRLPTSEAQDRWNQIFRLFRATGENAQREVKLGVYAYYAVNGSSKETKHARDMNTGGGASVLAADVLDVIGKDHIRQFLRADVDEAYSALKESGVLEQDEVFVHKSMAKGIPRGFMHCAVDYLRGCSLMTPEESEYAERHFVYSTMRARGARGGATLDEVRDGRIEKSLKMQREDSRVGRVASDEF